MRCTVLYLETTFISEQILRKGVNFLVSFQENKTLVQTWGNSIQANDLNQPLTMGHPSKDLGERVRGWGGGSCLGQRPFLVLVFPPQSPCRLSHHNHPKTRQKQKSVIRISGCLTNNRSSQMHEAIGHNRNSTPLKNETYSLSYALIISSWSGVNNRFPMSIDKATCNGAALNFLIKLILVKMKLVKHGHVFNLKKLKQFKKIFNFFFKHIKSNEPTIKGR